MNPIRLLGQAEGVVNGALAILRPNGKPDQVEVGPESGHLVVEAGPGPGTVERVAAVIGGLNPRGDKRAALQALYPHLPAKALNVVLGTADRYSEALENDGVVTSEEYMSLGLGVLQDAFQ
jgi:hypothetical protein